MTDITFRTSCKDCKFNGRCLLAGNSRMIKKRCYIDAIAEKLNIKSEAVVNRSNNFVIKYGFDFSLIASINKDYWLRMSNRERLEDIKCNLKRFAKHTNETVANEDIKLFLAVANCYFLAWRDEEYIKCVKCGKTIKNSKQRNRKYCNDCKNDRSKALQVKTKICIDCGVEFYPEHNRVIRCYECQTAANKAYARERVKRCRERKRNGLEKKS